MIPVYVTGGEITEKEKMAYVRRAKEQYPDRELARLDIKLDGDFVDLHYQFQPVNFERIRRITGYLVGTMDRWNNGKRAEESDRVKHDTGSAMEQL